MKNRLTDQQKIDLVSKYLSGASANQLAKMYEISCTAVLGILRRRNIEIRK